MEIEISQAIKTFFSNTSLRMVFCEAIANSLDANAENINISIEIEDYKKPSTLSIEIHDDGDGFGNDGLKRFSKLLTPKDALHKGIGRLIFLEYFNKVDISSRWESTSIEFIFDEKFDKDLLKPEYSIPGKSFSRLKFHDFKKQKIKSYNDINPIHLKDEIIREFLPKFLEFKEIDRNFKISISLNTKTENEQKSFANEIVKITPNDIPKTEKTSFEFSQLGQNITIKIDYFVNQNTYAASRLDTYLNIDKRCIPFNLFNSKIIPTYYSAFFLFSSHIFHTSSDNSRQKLILPESIDEQILFEQMREAISGIVFSKIPEIKEKNRTVIETAERKYPHLVGLFNGKTYGLIDSNNAILEAQYKFFSQQRKILECEDLNENDYNESIELSSRVLTEYILHRDKIIATMEAMDKSDPETKIHELICPRYNKFSQADVYDEIYRNNAWLLDDKFMSFRTILSEAQTLDVIKEITPHANPNEEISGRPDISLIFSGDPYQESPVDVVIVELKRKNLDYRDNSYVLFQLLERAQKLTDYCENIQRMWYYAIIDFTPELERAAKQLNFVELHSKGKVFYRETQTTRESDNKSISTPILLISFDAIINDAKSRNHTFLEILKKSIREFSNIKKQSTKEILKLSEKSTEIANSK